MRSLHHRDGHLGWDRDLPPVLDLDPGDEVEVVLADCFDGQLGPDATADDVARLDLARGNPLTGPIRVAGARPGGTVLVEVLDVAIGAVGWTTLLPGFGLLADDFPDPHVVVTRHTASPGGGPGVLVVGDLAEVPAAPFLGTVGLAPAAPGPHSVIPPRRVGGNLDCRLLGPGVTLALPAEVHGASLSVGDPHARQGDGEVCGTAIETTATARLRVSVDADLAIPSPQLRLDRAPDALPGPRHVTTGVGPDLHVAARDATRAMVDHLARTAHLAPEDAYVLCSVLGDLRIAEVVDAPNWVVTMDLPLAPLRS